MATAGIGGWHRAVAGPSKSRDAARPVRLDRYGRYYQGENTAKTLIVLVSRAAAFLDLRLDSVLPAADRGGAPRSCALTGAPDPGLRPETGARNAGRQLRSAPGTPPGYRWRPEKLAAESHFFATLIFMGRPTLLPRAWATNPAWPEHDAAARPPGTARFLFRRWGCGFRSVR